MVRAASYGVPRAPYYSGTPLNACSSRRLPGFHRLWPAFPGRSSGTIQLKAPATPGRIPVWAIPISLAATYGIDVSFFSCRYLDVSVPCVRFLRLYIHRRITRRWGFPIRKSRGQSLICQLTRAYRRLSRPSSPLDAKASTIHP